MERNLACKKVVNGVLWIFPDIRMQSVIYPGQKNTQIVPLKTTPSCDFCERVIGIDVAKKQTVTLNILFSNKYVLLLNM